MVARGSARAAAAGATRPDAVLAPERARDYGRRALHLLAVCLASVLAFVACSRVSEPAGVVSIDFSDYRGTRGTLPEGMFVTGENAEAEPVGPAFYPFSGVFDADLGEPFGGFGAFTANGESYSFGIRERGTTGLRDARVFLRYTNETEQPIVGFRVSYEVETWVRGERDNRIRLKYHTDTRGFSDVRDIVSTVNPAGALEGGDDDADSQPVTPDRSTADGPEALVDGSRDENRTRVSVSFLLSELEADGEAGLNPYKPLAPGDVAYFRWQYSNGELRDGETRSALALNNIRVEPVLAEETDGAGGRHRAESAADAGSHSESAAAADAERHTPSDLPRAPLAFSRPAGFHADAFPLELASSLSGATIYYTVDGSRPDPTAVMSDSEWEALPQETRTRTHVYEGPISLAELLSRRADLATIQTSNEEGPWSWVEPPEDIERAVVVRAVAIAGPSRTDVRANTYLFAAESEGRFSLPVFSVATDRGNFFDPERGIYVPGTAGNEDFWQSNFLRRGTDWEREVHLEFFDSGERVIRQNLGVRIHGNFSRSLPQKTLRLYARSDYGTSRLSHRFFETPDRTDFNRLLLRNGGNDWYRTMLTDPVMQSLVEHLAFDTQAYRPAILFLNGEYWGIHNIRERYDQHYLETNYALPRDQVIILEDDGLLDVGDESFVHTFTDFRERLAEGHYTSWDEVNRSLDLGPYLDYLVAKIYSGNYDWPQNNIRFWRYVGEDTELAPSPRDGRWRIMMYDLDVSLGHGQSLTYDLVAWTFGDTDTHPFLPEGDRAEREEAFIINQSLLEIPEVREDFLSRFEEHLATTFHPDRVSEHIDGISGAVEAEMERHIARWGRPQSMDEWRSHIEAMHTFARERPAIVLEQLSRHFRDR